MAIYVAKEMYVKSTIVNINNGITHVDKIFKISSLMRNGILKKV